MMRLSQVILAALGGLGARALAALTAASAAEVERGSVPGEALAVLREECPELAAAIEADAGARGKSPEWGVCMIARFAAEYLPPAARKLADTALNGAMSKGRKKRG